MESLSDTKWDVVISGTGLQNSLLALALSRSDKKILHVDQNDYYGGAEAAFSLQEVGEWVDKVQKDALQPFRNATLWKADSENPESQKLSFSRAYTLTLSPQIIYTKSELLAQLVSSKVYRQLEFQAVGNWWIFAEGSLKRLPNGREDIFQDKSIDNRAKRSLMKFLKFVVDYENQTETWEAHANDNLQNFLSSQFQFPPQLQTVIAALTLSLDPPDNTTVRWALSRIARHLTSIGVFGPGFGAVFPKWGGGAEIAQVACRAGAVGGGVYVLGTGIQDVQNAEPRPEDEATSSLSLSNGETVRTKRLIPGTKTTATSKNMTSKVIAVVSSSLNSIFMSSVEGSPLSAVSVVVFPPNTLSIEGSQLNPIYIMAHSSETGECPSSQSVLYASTSHREDSKLVLEGALSAFLKSVDDSEAQILYKLHYDQQESPDSSLDLAFDDQMLDAVEKQWKEIVGENDTASFMQFEERNSMNADDDNDDDEY
ncbi:hypothetical protein G7Y89_g2682 [Cudoniella acicularis]|uniref:Rab proteins geranylgeranyltransferase n=1 Tax=Cudoniella acicularis TaxID=354080 RepID=A0A8H4W5W9_9HELO|nr:hypothetical protein G7Y89_g2682 [Cudoniella acicularis]